MKTSSFFITLTLLWLGHFLVDFMIGVWPIYKTMAHLDLATAGVLAGICAFLGEGMQIVFGTLGDRGHRKTLIIIGVAMTAASALYPYLNGYFPLFVLLLLTYIGSGAFHPSAVGLIGRLASHRQGLLVAIFATGGSLGMACSQFIFSHVYNLFVGNTIFLIIPTILLVLYAVFQEFVGIDVVPTETAHNKKINFSMFKQCLQNRNIMLLFGVQLFSQMMLWGTTFLLPDLLLSRHYENWICYGAGHFSFIMGAVVMSVPAGYLADKISGRKVILGGVALGIIALYTFLFFGQNFSNAFILLSLFITGSCLWIIAPVSLALGNQLMPNNPGLISSFLMGVVWCFAEGIGPGGGGFLTRFFDGDAPAKAVACLGILLFFSLAAAAFLPAIVRGKPVLEPMLAE